MRYIFIYYNIIYIILLVLIFIYIKKILNNCYYIETFEETQKPFDIYNFDEKSISTNNEESTNKPIRNKEESTNKPIRNKEASTNKPIRNKESSTNKPIRNKEESENILRNTKSPLSRDKTKKLLNKIEKRYTLNPELKLKPEDIKSVDSEYSTSNLDEIIDKIKNS